MIKKDPYNVNLINIISNSKLSKNDIQAIGTATWNYSRSGNSVFTYVHLAIERQLRCHRSIDRSILFAAEPTEGGRLWER